MIPPAAGGISAADESVTWLEPDKALSVRADGHQHLPASIAVDHEGIRRFIVIIGTDADGCGRGLRLARRKLFGKRGAVPCGDGREGARARLKSAACSPLIEGAAVSVGSLVPLFSML